MNFLPKEIFNLIYEYFDPVKDIQRENMRQICITFDEANKKTRFDIISTYSRMCWFNLCKPEDLEFPAVSTILENLSFYRTHKKAINNMLNQNEHY